MSASGMQSAVPAYYPPNVSNIAGVQQADPFNFVPNQDTNMWGYTASFPTVDPACIITSRQDNMQSSSSSLSPRDLAQPQLNHSPNTGLKRNSIDLGSMSYRVKYGQVTPPSDDSPVSTTVQPAVPQSSIEGSETLPKRRRGTGGSSQSASVSLASTGRGSTSAEPSSPGGDKQEKTRARNRLAASKCRQKKKEQNSQLEATYREQREKRERLFSDIDSLKNELVECKSALLAHSNCGHEGIQRYIQDMAKKLTTSTDETLRPRPSIDQGYGNQQLAVSGQEQRFFGLEIDAMPPPM
ncbi:hypothetical protein BJX61DRAFT_543307 [Aspergillus egyptiacus]|nr:hypothetical protein BJX61DRAFT_543307 [Aspergillus egyptiacus]